MTQGSTAALPLAIGAGADASRRPPDKPLASGHDSSLTDRLVCRVTWGFVALGVVLRVVRYLRNFPLWGDETFLAANFIDRDYQALMGPLDYGQICPLFFLWVERAVVSALGFSEWSLRLFPTLCSIASVALFYRISGHLMRGVPRLLAVAVFAVSLAPIRHGGEVKPYATDLFVSLCLLGLAVKWLGTRNQSRRLWGLAAFVPLALGLSYPSVFIAGGVGLGLAPAVWGSGRRGVKAAFAAYLATTLGAFLVLFRISTRAQLGAVPAGLSHYWAEAFPPLAEPLKLGLWLVRTHTGRMFSYPAGGDWGASGLTTLCAAAGVAVLWNRCQRTLLATLLAPFGLALAAASMQLYPYGGSTRLALYLGPIICLLVGLGASALGTRALRPGDRPRFVAGMVLLLAGLGLFVLGHDLAYPYKSVYDSRSRDFARWFWTTKAADAELACVKVDLGTVFKPRHWQRFRSSFYLTYEQVYFERHRRRAPLRWDAISATRPLRCVLYNEGPHDDPAIAAWLARMSARYVLKSSECYVVNAGIGDSETGFEDRYLVYDFIPRPPTSLVAGNVSPDWSGPAEPRPATPFLAPN
jgi:hypothetical protein